MKSVLGNDAKVAESLELQRNFITRWRREGYIPERHALAVERLGIVHDGEKITAYDVLFEAERARAANIEAAYAAMEGASHE